MFQRFDQDNNSSSFVKALLAQTDIPIVPFGGISENSEGFYIKNNYFYFHSSKSGEEDKICFPYIWGKKYEGLTTRYISNNSYYDSETHYYLGEYLRSIKGNFNINLMPYYNCFNNSYAKDIVLERNGAVVNFKITNNADTGYQVLLVPIKFNKEYTIAIDCPSPVLMKPIFYGNKGLAQSSNLISYTELLKNSDLVLPNSNFRKPTLYKGITILNNNPDVNLFSYENFLRLAIQLPSKLKYSVVVLEGDYTKSNMNVVSSFSEKLTTEELNNVLVSPLSLLQLPTTYPVAFSNRLIEYLTQNVITSEDIIDDNIKRVQEYASSIINQNKNGSILPYSSYTKGIWNNELSIYLFNLMKNTPYNKKMKLDYNGFLDKDTESILTRGQQV